MVPGFAAGQYDAPQLEIDIPSLAERAGADFVLAEISGIDADKQRIHTKGGPSVEYDIASLDLGSTVAGADVPGVREHALFTRPIGDLIDRIAHHLARLRTLSKPLRLVVVGGGAGGIELAFCLKARLREEGSAGARISVVESAPRVLSRASTAIIERVQRAAARRRIELRCEERVARVLHIGGKWGLAVEGTGVMRVKDWIDRRFMARYR